MAGLEKLHSENLAIKEAETNARISKAAVGAKRFHKYHFTV